MNATTVTRIKTLVIDLPIGASLRTGATNKGLVTAVLNCGYWPTSGITSGYSAAVERAGHEVDRTSGSLIGIGGGIASPSTPATPAARA